MNKGLCLKLAVFMGFVFSLFLFSAPQILAAQNSIPKGNILGFVFAKDGTTPLEGAVVKFKNLTSGSLFISSKSDGYGIFKPEGAESGIYSYVVVTEQGDFNADSLVGLQIAENGTAKLSIALDPYDRDVAEAVSETYREQEKNGEALIGTIAGFNPNTRLAQ